nr:DUF2092 domain-containing protein [uncultured Desulfobacter sp.]
MLHKTIRRWSLICIAMIMASVFTACSQPRSGKTQDVSREQPAFSRLKAMSDTLSAAGQFRIETEEQHEWVDSGGETAFAKGSCVVDVVRPGNMRIEMKGSGSINVDATLYFYKSTIAFEGRIKKIWAFTDTRETIDGMLDDLAERFDLPIPVSDFLYSSAYDSLISENTQGKWIEQVVVGGKGCDHLVFTDGDLQWELWVSTGDEALPCKMKILRNGPEGKSRSELTFTKIDLTYRPDMSEFVFTPQEDYVQVPVIENINRDDAENKPTAGEK